MIPQPIGASAPTPVMGEDVLKEAKSANLRSVTALDLLRFLLVSAYLVAVLIVLVGLRRIHPGNPFRALLRVAIARLFYRVKEPRKIEHFVPELGYCFLTTIHHRIPSDLESASRIQVCEDGVPLPKPHADHSVIRNDGRGAFSHWGSAIYLSTSDNTDPRTNGRSYTYKESQS
jgi:hypothetical protein